MLRIRTFFVADLGLFVADLGLFVADLNLSCVCVCENGFRTFLQSIGMFCVGLDLHGNLFFRILRTDENRTNILYIVKKSYK